MSLKRYKVKTYITKYNHTYFQVNAAFQVLHIHHRSGSASNPTLIKGFAGSRVNISKGLALSEKGRANQKRVI